MTNDSDQAVYDTLIQDDTYWRKNPGCLRDVQRDVIDYLKDLKAKIVLDAGCGRGDLSAEMARWLYNVTACDLCDADSFVKRHALLACPKITFFQCNLADMPFGDDAFDAAICVDVMEHVFPEDVDAVFRELMRVTRKAYLQIACYPSHHGEHRDLHRSIHSPGWWRSKAREHGDLLTHKILPKTTPKGKKRESIILTMRRRRGP